eukprot:801448-Pelagomonas_calceolata.AAC.2
MNAPRSLPALKELCMLQFLNHALARAFLNAGPMCASGGAELRGKPNIWAPPRKVHPQNHQHPSTGSSFRTCGICKSQPCSCQCMFGENEVNVRMPTVFSRLSMACA